MPGDSLNFEPRHRSRAKVLGISLILLAVGYLSWDYLPFETVWGRERVSRGIQSLVVRLRADPNNKQALNKLRTYLNGDWSFARTAAAVAAGQLGPIARELTPDLIRGLDCGDPFVERESARALGPVTAGLPDAVPALIAKLQYEERDSAWFSADSLGEIGAPAFVAIPALEAATRSEQLQMAMAAKEALKRLQKLQRARDTDPIH